MMTIMRGGHDVTQEILDHAEALRAGPHGRRQRDMLFGILTKALLSFEDIPVPWLDDCIEATRSALRELRAAIPRD